MELSTKTNLTYRQVYSWYMKKNKKNKNNQSIKSMQPKQILKLKEYFNNVNKNPTSKDYKELSKNTDLPVKKVSSWFRKQRFLGKS